MKEFIIFLFLFLIVFSFTLFIFNGRFIYAQLKYHFLGPSPISFKPDIQLQKLAIPTIGVEAPIVLPESIDEYTLQRALEKGVIYWPESDLPDEEGVVIILGHSSAYPWYQGNYGSVFSLLNRLEKGDEIFLFSEDKKYVYQVIEKEIQMPEDLNIKKEKGKSTLYLISCWPIKTTWKRIAVQANLTRIE